MTAFRAWIRESHPGLHLWRLVQGGQSSELQFDRQPVGADADGFRVFQVELNHQVHEPLGFKLFAEKQGALTWESDAHNRFLPRLEQYRFPDDVWFVHGVRRAVLANPCTAARDQVRVHVITAQKYRGGRLYVWLPGDSGRFVEASGDEPEGVFFDVRLAGAERHLCAFKVVTQNGVFEADSANRLWTSHDGAEIWTHADTDAVVSEHPEQRVLTVHYRQGIGLDRAPTMHLWGSASDFVEDVPGTPQPDGEWSFLTPALYTGHEYRFTFFHPDHPDEARRWEHGEAERRVVPEPSRNIEIWTLEGDHELFIERPARDRTLSIEVVDRPPSCPLVDPLVLDVWVNRARGLLHRGVTPGAQGRFVFDTYPELVTAFRFRSGDATEHLERHTHKVPATAAGTTELFAVLERHDPLERRPDAPLFRDPPSAGWIERPGAWHRDGRIRFAVHAPTAARVQVIGEWTDWRARPVHMHSTSDGSYWWAEVPASAIHGGDFHGALYKFLISNVREQQDPAADWVESSNPQHASKLVDHARYAWRSQGWRTPGKDYLIVYQLHPKRFTNRFAPPGVAPLEQAAEEIRSDSGYLRSLGITAILLMPVNEFAGDDSWGYNPAFFYAVESAYGGPEALKRFVDACHEHGIAVLLDVVFNHAGTSDNALWSLARDSFFKGDTAWGALINFAHPQVGHFFEQNLRFLARHYRVDGFRLDHTWTIRYSDQVGAYVTSAGSHGGWEFLHKLRRAAHAENPGAILMAEHLPNEWDLTNVGGPMDSQWCDDFHDRLEDACRGHLVMPRLADALKLTHSACDDWYKATNYPESHDEVGNENDRIAQVGRFGQGLRQNKVAAAVTLLSRGIPMWFMGAEAGEHRQFLFNRNDALDLAHYDSDPQARRMRAWWKALTDLRRHNPRIQGPAPLAVTYAQDQLLAFSRGNAGDYIVVANFGDWSGWKPLAELNVPDGQYTERLNSTWEAFRVEQEDEHASGHGRVGRGDWLHVPDHGVVVLERD